MSNPYLQSTSTSDQTLRRSELQPSQSQDRFLSALIQINYRMHDADLLLGYGPEEQGCGRAYDVVVVVTMILRFFAAQTMSTANYLAR
jgi:hypothetical protein